MIENILYFPNYIMGNTFILTHPYQKPTYIPTTHTLEIQKQAATKQFSMMGEEQQLLSQLLGL